MKKNTKIVIIGIVAIFIVSMMIIPISALVIRSTISGNATPLFIFDLSKTVSIYDILFLYYTVVGIGVMGLLTWAIFAFSQKKDIDENDKRRMWIYSEFLFLVNQVFQYQEKQLSAFTVSNDWMERITLCHEFLSKSQYSKLLEFYGKCFRLMTMTYAGDSIEALSEEIFDEVLQPFYKYYKYDIGNYNIADASIILSPEYIAILNAIYPNKKNNLSTSEHGQYDNGKDLYKIDIMNMKYSLWSSNGDLLCEATFVDGTIYDGYAILSYAYKSKYKGFIKDGFKSGKGVVYNEKGFPIMEGEWKGGWLLNGEIRSVLVPSTDKSIRDVYSVSISEVKEEDAKRKVKNSVSLVEVADYEVKDGVLCNENNIRVGNRSLY